MRGWMIAAMLAASPAMAQEAVPAPSAEAEALGKHIAERGTLATLFPLMVAKDTEALIADHPELDAAGQTRLRATAAGTARAAIDRLTTAIGHRYAALLPLADLQAIAAFTDSPAAIRWRGVEPQVLVATITSLDGFDFKREAWAAYCRAPGAACPVKAPKRRR